MSKKASLSAHDLRLAELEAIIKRQQQEIASSQYLAKRLQGELHEIGSLPRHMKRAIRRGIGRADRLVTKSLTTPHPYRPAQVSNSADSTREDLLRIATDYDTVQFAAFNLPVKSNVLLGPYTQAKEKTKNVILGMRERKREKAAKW